MKPTRRALRIALAAGLAALPLQIARGARTPGPPGLTGEPLHEVLEQLRESPRTDAGELARIEADLGDLNGRAGGGDSLDSGLRLAIAELARRTAERATVAPALAALDDPDAGVRGALLGLLSRDELGDHLGAERVAAAARLAREDRDAELRSRAIEVLGRVPDPAAGPALESLLHELPAEEQVDAARTLGDVPRLRDFVSRIVRESLLEAPGPGAPDPGAPGTGESGAGGSADSGAARDSRRIADGALGVLVEAYGVRLAELPGGGLSARDRAPIVQAWRDPSPDVRLGARLALEGLVRRADFLGDPSRATDVLAGLVGEGLDPALLDYRLAWLHLTRGDDPAAALPHARRLAEGHRADLELGDRRWRAMGLLLEAAARLAQGQAEPALEGFERAADVIDGMLAERLDLRPRRGRVSRAMTVGQASSAELRAVVELQTTTALIASGRPGDDPELLEHARHTHELGLAEQLMDWRGRQELDLGSLDDLLDHDLGPRRLVLSNPDSASWPPDAAIDLQVKLMEVLASVAPDEALGFEPSFAPPEASTGESATGEPAAGESSGTAEDGSVARIGGPLADPRRFELLRDLYLARLEVLDEQLAKAFRSPKPDFEQILGLQRRRRQLLADFETAEERGWVDLLELRLPSSFALTLAADLRAEARPAEARELCEHLLADLRANDHAMLAMGDWLLVRIDLAVGASLTDEGRPQEAEVRLQQALDRLEALENSLTDRLAEVADDPELAALLRGDLALTRARKADALVSLAVNANVGLGDPERALAWFERAFELQQGDFNRVLLACYRARSGRTEEALAQVREVVVSPPLYYNLACTYALIGETDLALDYLKREWDENLPSEGARRRQREWALKDPDLASIRDDPRFLRIVGADE